MIKKCIYIIVLAVVAFGLSYLGMETNIGRIPYAIVDIAVMIVMLSIGQRIFRK